MKRFHASIQNRNKQYHIGCFENEIEAAMAVNKKCDELNIPLKNPSVRDLDITGAYKKLKVILCDIFTTAQDIS